MQGEVLLLDGALYTEGILKRVMGKVKAMCSLEFFLAVRYYLFVSCL